MDCRQPAGAEKTVGTNSRMPGHNGGRQAVKELNQHAAARVRQQAARSHVQRWMQAGSASGYQLKMPNLMGTMQGRQ